MLYLYARHTCICRVLYMELYRSPGCWVYFSFVLFWVIQLVILCHWLWWLGCTSSVLGGRHKTQNNLLVLVNMQSGGLIWGTYWSSNPRKPLGVTKIGSARKVNVSILRPQGWSWELWVICKERMTKRWTEKSAEKDICLVLQWNVFWG